MNNTCICCGEVIPESRQVCLNCENKWAEKEHENYTPYDRINNGGKTMKKLYYIVYLIVMVIVTGLLTIAIRQDIVNELMSKWAYIWAVILGSVIVVPWAAKAISSFVCEIVRDHRQTEN